MGNEETDMIRLRKKGVSRSQAPAWECLAPSSA